MPPNRVPTRYSSVPENSGIPKELLILRKILVETKVKTSAVRLAKIHTDSKSKAVAEEEIAVSSRRLNLFQTEILKYLEELMENCKELALAEKDYLMNKFGLQQYQLNSPPETLLELQKYENQTEQLICDYREKYREQLEVKTYAEFLLAEKDKLEPGVVKIIAADVSAASKRVDMFLNELIKFLIEYKDLSAEMRQADALYLESHVDQQLHLQGTCHDATTDLNLKSLANENASDTSKKAPILVPTDAFLYHVDTDPNFEHPTADNHAVKMQVTFASSHSLKDPFDETLNLKPIYPETLNDVPEEVVTATEVTFSSQPQTGPTSSSVVHSCLKSNVDEYFITLTKEEHDALLHRCELLSTNLLKDGIDELYIKVATQLSEIQARNTKLERKVNELESQNSKNIALKSSKEDIGWRKYWLTKLQSHCMVHDLKSSSCEGNDSIAIALDQQRNLIVSLMDSLRYDGVSLAGASINPKPLPDQEFRSKLVSMTVELNTAKQEAIQTRKDAEEQMLQYLQIISNLKDQLNQNCASTDLQLEQHKDEILQRQLFDSHSQIDVAQKQVEELTRERDTWKQEYIDTQRLLDETSRKLQSQIDDLLKMNEELEIKNVHLHQQIGVIDMALKESQGKLLETAATADSKISELFAELDRISKTDQAYDSKVEQLEKSLQEYIKKEQQLKDKKAELQAEIENYKAEVAELKPFKEQLGESKVQLSDLQTKLKHLQLQVDQKKRSEVEILRLSQELQGSRQDASSFEKRASLLQQELQEMQQKFSIQSQKMGLLQTQHEKSIISTKKLEMELQNAKSNRTDLSFGSIEAANEEIRQLKEKLQLEMNNVEVMKKTLDDVTNASWW